MGDTVGYWPLVVLLIGIVSVLGLIQALLFSFILPLV